MLNKGKIIIEKIVSTFESLEYQRQRAVCFILSIRLLLMGEKDFICEEVNNSQQFRNILNRLEKDILYDNKMRAHDEDLSIIQSLYTENPTNSFMIDSLTIVEILIQNQNDKKVKLVPCINSYIESIDLLVQDLLEEEPTKYDANYENRIFEHELMQKELNLVQSIIFQVGKDDFTVSKFKNLKDIYTTILIFSKQ